MGEASIKISKLLSEKVMAKDILKVHRSINRGNLSNITNINMENKLLINSFSNNFLFSNKYLYYRLSIILKDMGLYMEQSKLEENFETLLSKCKVLMSDNCLNHYQKIEKLNQLFLDVFYCNYLDEQALNTDIKKVCHKIKNRKDNLVSKDIIKVEKNALLNPPNNKMIYYKLAMAIKEIGTYTNNAFFLNQILSSLLDSVYSISLLDVDDYQKMQLIELLFFKYTDINFNVYKMVGLKIQLNSITDEMEILKNDLLKFNDEKQKEKILLCKKNIAI